MPLLGEITAARAPGMDVLRLGAATLVIVAHSYNLTVHAEPFGRFGGPDFGDIAVAVFFAISGFLVTASWISDPRTRSFALRRALRILPGLWMVLLLTTLVGLIVTALSTTGYLTSLVDLALSARALDRVLDAAGPAGRVRDQPLRRGRQRLALDAAGRGHGLRRHVRARHHGPAGATPRARALATLALFVFQETLLPPANSFNVTTAGSVLHWVVHFGLFYMVGALFFLYREHVRLSFIAAALGLGAVARVLRHRGGHDRRPDRPAVRGARLRLPRACRDRSLHAPHRRPLVRHLHLRVPDSADDHPLRPGHLRDTADRLHRADHLCLRVLLLAPGRAARAALAAPPHRRARSRAARSRRAARARTGRRRLAAASAARRRPRPRGGAGGA